MPRFDRSSGVTTLAVLACAATTMTACADHTSTSPIATAARVVAIAGFAQTVTAGTTGRDSLAVVVYAANGEVLSGASVLWTLVDGAGTLSGARSVSDQQGVARIAYTAATTVGSAHVNAVIDALEPAVFEQRIVAAAPARLLPMRLYADTVGGGERDNGTVVQVVDRYGNAVSNVAVSVAVEAAVQGDVLVSSSLISDARGYVAASFVPADATGDRVLVFSTAGGLSLSYRLAVVASTPAAPPPPPPPAPPAPPTLD
jgi:hypothetical protein